MQPIINCHLHAKLILSSLVDFTNFRKAFCQHKVCHFLLSHLTSCCAFKSKTRLRQSTSEGIVCVCVYLKYVYKYERSLECVFVRSMPTRVHPSSLYVACHNNTFTACQTILCGASSIIYNNNNNNIIIICHKCQTNRYANPSVKCVAT